MLQVADSVVSVIVDNARRTRVHVGLVSAAVGNVLELASTSGLIVRSIAYLALIEVDDVCFATVYGSLHAVGSIVNEIKPVVAKSAYIGVGLDSGTIGNVNLGARIPREIKSSVTCSASVLIGNVTCALGDVLLSAKVETVDVVIGVADRTEVLINLICHTVRQVLLRATTSVSVKGSGTDVASVGSRSINHAVWDSAKGA